MTALARTLNPRLLALVLVPLWLLLAVWNLSQWQTQASDLAWSAKLLVKDVTQTVLWTCAWAWVTYVLQRQSMLSVHVAIAATASIFDEVILGLAVPWLFFSLGWPWPQGLNKSLWISLVVFTALMHLRMATGPLQRKIVSLWALASTMVICVYGLQAWAEINDHEATKKLPYESNIYPAYWIKTPPLEIDDGLKALWSRNWIKVGEP